MKAGLKNTMVSVGAGLALTAITLFSPADALAKAKPKAQATIANVFQKEKDKIEKLQASPIQTSQNPKSSYSIPGLSVEQATSEALVRRLEHAQVIIQGMIHCFELGYDKNAQLLLQLQNQLNIGAIFIEPFAAPRDQDSLTAFCTTGRMNSTVEWTAFAVIPRAGNTHFSMLWTLTLARLAGVDILALHPDIESSKYEFMQRPRQTTRYVLVSNPDMAAVILDALASHPGQRMWVQVGAAHLSGLQKILADAGVTSASFEVWAPSMKADRCKKEAPDDRLSPLINRHASSVQRHLPLLQACPSDALVDNPNHRLSPFSDFILYTPDKPYSDLDYMRLMPQYFAREIRKLESQVGREWMVEMELMDSAGTLCSGLPSP